MMKEEEDVEEEEENEEEEEEKEEEVERGSDGIYPRISLGERKISRQTPQ